MNIVLTCGHEVDSLDRAYPVMTKTFDRDGSKAVSYSLICGPCEDYYRQNAVILDSEEAAEHWLDTEQWF